MARRATSLGPKPSLFVFCFFFFFWFLSSLCLQYTKKTLVFPKKGIFCIFLVFLFLCPLAFFGLPLFQFLFLCFSVVLFFLRSFLSLFFAFFLSLIFVSFFLFFLLCFCFMKRTTSKYSITTLFSLKYFLFFWFPVFFSL